jgi:hypothetical protein
VSAPEPVRDLDGDPHVKTLTSGEPVALGPDCNPHRSRSRLKSRPTGEPAGSLASHVAIAWPGEPGPVDGDWVVIVPCTEPACTSSTGTVLRQRPEGSDGLSPGPGWRHLVSPNANPATAP